MEFPLDEENSDLEFLAEGDEKSEMEFFQDEDQCEIEVPMEEDEKYEMGVPVDEERKSEMEVPKDEGKKSKRKVSSVEEKSLNFHEMELDDRILKAVADLGWREPTLIQEKAIPLLLTGKDVIMRAKTGSGKTAAFAIPVIQKILKTKLMDLHQEVKALVLAPSSELCSQIYRNFLELTSKCSLEVQCVNLSTELEIAAQRPLLMSCPDVVVSVPSRVLEHLKAGNLVLKDSFETLVIDEADLIFSFGYENEVKEIFRYLPPVYQAILASATLSDEVLDLKSLILHNPVTLKLYDYDLPPASQLSHYVLRADEHDKATILCTVLKLGLVNGKILIFVNTVDKCYKLKLFLEQFGEKCCVLNSELPANVRSHSVRQFNRGMYNIIIASDELALEAPKCSGKSGLKKSKRVKDKESGVARGIDFNCVSNVLNFDFPLDLNSYIHRAGRTARGMNHGTVLSFVSLREEPMLDEVKNGIQSSNKEEHIFKSFEFKMSDVEGFRYRSRDAWRAVTRVAVREARLKEIKQELINSEVLKGYFEDNPNDYKVLRHDKALHTVKLQHHLKNVPEYLVPIPLRKEVKEMEDTTSLSKKRVPMTVTKKKYQRKKLNPLLNFEFMGFKDRTLKKKQQEKDKKKSFRM